MSGSSTTTILSSSSWVWLLLLPSRRESISPLPILSQQKLISSEGEFTREEPDGTAVQSPGRCKQGAAGFGFAWLWGAPVVLYTQQGSLLPMLPTTLHFYLDRHVLSLPAGLDSWIRWEEEGNGKIHVYGVCPCSAYLPPVCVNPVIGLSFLDENMSHHHTCLWPSGNTP